MRAAVGWICVLGMVTGCAGSWVPASSIPSERIHDEVDHGLIIDVTDFTTETRHFLVRVDARCEQSWNTTVTTRHQERFRSTTRWPLWLALGGLTAAAGAIGVGAGGDTGRPVGFGLLALGGGELAYGGAAAYAGTRRRTRTTSYTRPGRDRYACGRTVLPAEFTLTTPWGTTVAPRPESDDRTLRFSSTPACVNDECVRSYRGEFVIRHTPMGQSWTKRLADTMIERLGIRIR